MSGWQEEPCAIFGKRYRRTPADHTDVFAYPRPDGTFHAHVFVVSRYLSATAKTLDRVSRDLDRQIAKVLA